MKKLEECKLYKDAIEIAILLSQLNNNERAKIHGILIGMNMEKELNNNS